MHPHDKPRFGNVILAMSEMYGRAFSPSAIELWFKTLEVYDIEAIERAVAAAMRDPDHGQFCPKPADVIRHIDGGKSDAALAAWADVHRAVRHIGSYASVVFDDAITMAVISDMGGWIALTTKKGDEWPFVAKEFENRYRGYRVRSEAFAHPAVLLGITDLENVQRGYPAMTPRLVGNEAKCLQVQATGGQAARLDARSGEIAQSALARIANRKEGAK